MVRTNPHLCLGDWRGQACRGHANSKFLILSDNMKPNFMSDVPVHVVGRE